MSLVKAPLPSMVYRSWLQQFDISSTTKVRLYYLDIHTHTKWKRRILKSKSSTLLKFNLTAKVLCVLHFTEIFDDRILELNDSTSAASRSITQFCMQMYSSDVNIEDYDSQARESLSLYKLGLGVSPSSEGIPCAKAAGINERILARAIEVKLAVSERRELQPIGAVSDAHTMLTPLHIQGLRLLLSNRDWMSATTFELDDLKKCFQHAHD